MKDGWSWLWISSFLRISFVNFWRIKTFNEEKSKCSAQRNGAKMLCFSFVCSFVLFVMAALCAIVHSTCKTRETNSRKAKGERKKNDNNNKRRTRPALKQLKRTFLCKPLPLGLLPLETIAKESVTMSWSIRAESTTSFTTGASSKNLQLLTDVVERRWEAGQILGGGEEEVGGGGVGRGQHCEASARIFRGLSTDGRGSLEESCEWVETLKASRNNI